MFNNPYYGYPQQVVGVPQNIYQQPFQPQYQAPQSQPSIKCQIVDSLDAVKAKDVDLSGNPAWYPRADKSEVYCKQLNPNTGETDILVYKCVSKEPLNKSESSDQRKDFETIRNDIAELRDLILEHITAPKGGAQ